MKWTRNVAWTKTLNILELFITKDAKSAGQTGPYLAAGALLFSLVVVLLNLLSFTMTRDRPLIILVSSLIILLVILCCLGALKKGVKHELVTGSFQILLTTGMTYLIAYHGQSFFTPALFFFMVTILHSSLFSTYRLALIQSGYVVLSTAFIFWKTNEYGLAMPFHWPYEVFVDRLRIVIILVCLTTYLAMVLHEYFRKSAEQAMTGEREWLLRSSRLHEVSTLAESLSFQVYSPLREFGRDFGRLRSALGSEGFETLETERVRAMDCSVDELIQISRSFDWIYRSHKHDFLSGASIDLVLLHLRILLEGKALENGWILRFQSDRPDHQIMGDIPALMLLFVTLAHRNFDRFAASEKMALDVSASLSSSKQGDVEWRLSWPKTAARNNFFRFDSPKDSVTQMVDEIRESLVEELLRDCRATLEQKTTDTHFEIVIRMPEAV